MGYRIKLLPWNVGIQASITSIPGAPLLTLLLLMYQEEQQKTARVFGVLCPYLGPGRRRTVEAGPSTWSLATIWRFLEEVRVVTEPCSSSHCGRLASESADKGYHSSLPRLLCPCLLTKQTKQNQTCEITDQFICKEMFGR